MKQNSSSKPPKLFFSNISFSANEVDILDLFISIGNINDIQILRDKQERSLGCGYIEFEDPNNNQKAIDMLNGTLYKDSKIHLEISQPKIPSDHLEDHSNDTLAKLGKDQIQNKIEPNQDQFFDDSVIRELPALPPIPLPPPMFTMDQVPPPQALPLSTPPFMVPPDFPAISSNNESHKDYSKKKVNDKNYNEADYDYDYESDYYNSDYYYYSETEEEQKNKNISQVSQVLSHPSQYQLNPLAQNYDASFSLQPLGNLPPLPPLPPIGVNSASALINNSFVPSSRKAVYPPPHLDSVPLNERQIIQQHRHISSAFDIPNENELIYATHPNIPSSSLLMHSHDRHHHHRSSHRSHIDEYDQSIINRNEVDRQWMVMPPSKNSLYWRNKRAQVIEELKKAAYEEIRKASAEQSK